MFVLQAGPRRWWRQRTRSKCSSYTGARQRCRRPFYGTLTALLYQPVRRDWNNVSSGHCTRATQTKSISFHTRWWVLPASFVFFPSPHHRHHHFGLTSRCSCHSNRAIWQTWWQRSGKQRSVTKITLHGSTVMMCAPLCALVSRTLFLYRWTITFTPLTQSNAYIYKNTYHFRKKREVMKEPNNFVLIWSGTSSLITNMKKQHWTHLDIACWVDGRQNQIGCSASKGFKLILFFHFLLLFW